ncbi:ABC transporter ATP-binding protein [Planomicrobium sp. CPCC 101110]|uniref:ABC transporter ATP-binding protein n=1 Tax=Planomicrobium sp. CPCC 101110 TaxID=2599619 RepID=UPI0011B54A59|nr:ABC transporter ATP-binding protein [Planomicrobium sp. CPCC 101110]TWT25187.1 ABC transporter ATP-binding protein [Planomicrobium sp. CPCC 101110]
MPQLLEVQNLKVDFAAKDRDLTALKGVSLQMKKGETVCIVGESGSGKTVLSKSILRLIDHENGRIADGRILLDGTELTGLSQKELSAIRGEKVAMIFQEPMSAFDPLFTIGQQIVETILAHRQSNKAEAKKRAIYLLERVGIADASLRFAQYPNELSGGMLQRAMIAMALACGPDLLIADEPTTALDVTIQAQILQLLEELKLEFGMSILLITHDMGVAAEVADRIVVMYTGEIVEQATTAQLFGLPHHPYTNGLLQSVTKLDSDRSKPLFSIAGTIPPLSDLPSGCSFHPRCPFATEQCRNEKPPLRTVNGRETACWHSEQLVDRADWMGSGTKAEPVLLPPKAIVSASGEDLIVVEGLSKFYRIGQGRGFWRPRAYTHAVEDVSFSIKEGETFGLIGESGSGKSTLGRVLLQLEKATSGKVLFEGTDLASLGAKDLRQQRRHMQMIYQDPYGSVNPRWKVGDIIEEPLKVHEPSNAKENQEKAKQLLDAVGLSGNAYERYPHEFSGGQRQRIAIARAIALNPKFILADEAVSALDVSVQAQVVNLMKDLQQDLGLTYLFIGHGLNVVRHISDRIGVMYMGQLVEIAASETLFQRPAHHYTKGLISSIPVADIGKREKLASVQGEIPSPSRPPSGCRFHTRCPAATSRCKMEAPAMQEVEPGHWAACHHPAL